MRMANLLFTLDYDTIVNVIYNGSVVKCFRVDDYHTGHSFVYNSKIIKIDIPETKIVNVTVDDKVYAKCKTVTLDIYKDGSIMYNNKSFDNVDSLIRYMYNI